MRVRAVRADELVVRDVDGLHLIYHRGSGETHLIAPELLTILNAIGDEACDVDAVVTRLSELHELEADDGSVREAVAARVQELIALGLADTLQ
jgi:PqqD family protein of HPr-rel-A system